MNRSISGRRNGFFSPPKNPDWLWDPPRLFFNRYLGVQVGDIKRLGHVADHLLPTRAKPQNEINLQPGN